MNSEIERGSIIIHYKKIDEGLTTQAEVIGEISDAILVMADVMSQAVYENVASKEKYLDAVDSVCSMIQALAENYLEEQQVKEKEIEVSIDTQLMKNLMNAIKNKREENESK